MYELFNFLSFQGFSIFEDKESVSQKSRGAFDAAVQNENAGSSMPPAQVIELTLISFYHKTM